MDHIRVEVAPDHIESLTKVRKPIVAVEELVWNALDADATVIDVDVVKNHLDGLEIIRVRDNGHGIHHGQWRDAFGKLGGSAKLKMKTTPNGRRPHGKSGRGRFRAFGLGNTVRWHSTYRENGQCFRFEITGHKVAITDFEATDPVEVKASTGVEVEVRDFQKNFVSLTDRAEAALELARRLALYLRQYPGITIKYDLVPVDPRSMEDHVETYPLTFTLPEGNTSTAELTVIEWKYPTERAICLCDEDGFAREEQAAGIQAKGFHFTAYLKSALIAGLDEEGALEVGELNPTVKALLDAAKTVLKSHFRQRESLRATDLVRKWQEEQIYPYRHPPADPLEKVQQEVFDICAVKVYEYSPGFEATDLKNKRLTFRLIREAMETNPTCLQAILREVLALPQEQQEELAALLEKTRLGSIINAARIVMDRLAFLCGVDDLLHGEFKKTLNEPRQLHQILAAELWLFGEQYALGANEASLKTTLKAHIGILGRNALVEDVTDVKDLDGNDRRLDLMLYRSYPQTIENSFEHLVVELKRPSRKIGKEEISQIEEYALTVSADDRFDKERTHWTFLLVGTDLDTFAERKCTNSDRAFGHIHTGAVNIFVKRWSSIVAEARWRYEFFRDKLNYEATGEDGLEYLRRKHGDKLPETPNDTQP